MGRGAPMTVIKGGFALGLVRPADDWYTLYLATHLKLSGLATSSTGFSYKVIGRGEPLDYQSAGGLTEITVPDHLDSWADSDGFVRITTARPTPYNGGDSDVGLLRAEIAAHADRGDLGTVIAPEVRIVLYGRLDSLSVTQIVPAGIRSNTIVDGDIWYYKYGHHWPDGSVNGWYASEVHIFDNPQLLGHVNAGSAKLFWDC